MNTKTHAKQQDDTPREAQRSHGSTQNRSKKSGHTDQIGSSQNQTSQRPSDVGAKQR